MNDVRALSDRRVAHLLAGNLAGMAEPLDDALVYVHSTGLVQGKEGVRAFFAEVLQVTGLQRILRFESAGEGFVCLGFEQTLDAQLRREPGRSIQARAYFSELWRDVGGAWRLVHAQSTALPAPAQGQG
ncbi:YybH family protein [Variovorax ginsengisoli]|uniref:Ketosteroid isomerase-like protein n=1 Tax=Variovorax ginsengisoli TaxID=363844 RepID=A0ABT9S951_9BURK|nr:nuclear transport factor 2 family protein [Variovorax ginsengisoli]MDP9900881.1 ketosteroid isomerase-like protein [Variovorax ginsengisoli]